MFKSARKCSSLQLLIWVFLVSILVLLGISNVSASSSSPVTWVKLYGGALDDEAAAIVQTDYPLASGIYIRSPTNRTYSSSLLTLNASVTALVASNIKISMTYSLDGMPNNTLLTVIHSREHSFQATITGTADLPTLSYGSHNVTVYAKYEVNNASMEGVYYPKYVHLDNSTVYFTISDTIPPDELIPPIISNLSLENKTYNSTELLLSFNIDKTVSWIAYCLDNQANRTMAGLYDPNIWGNQFNKTLTGLSDGSHSLVVYANNTAGKTGASETVYFTVSTNSEQKIPEFPSWTPLLIILLSVTMTAIIYRRSIRKHNQGRK